MTKLLRCFLLLCSCLGSSSSVSTAEEATVIKKQPNVLLICVDDLRPELRSFGAEYIHSPNIDALAAAGRAFHHHFVQAPTCGASRYTLLTGQYGPAGNGALFQRAARVKTDASLVTPSLPAWFRQHGYTTVSVGKVSHHPGGRGGPDWNDKNQLEMPHSWDRHLLPAGAWQHPRGWMHGLANGEIRKNAKDMDLFQSQAGGDEIYPDGVSINEALRQLTSLSESKVPYFLAVGVLRPHLPFGAPAKYFELYKDTELPKIAHAEKPRGKTTWHGSGEFMKYNRWGRNPNTDADFAIDVRKAYAACVSYADAQVGRLINRLDQLGQRDNTIIVLWGDHGWHLGEHSIWGKHALFEESLHSPMIISTPKMSHVGEATQAMVETLDIFPTLCELAKLEIPTNLDGVSLLPLLLNPQGKGHAAIGYAGRAKTIRSDTHRLILHNDGFTELYDHTSAEKETSNVAEAYPDVVSRLTIELQQRLGR